MGAQARLSDPDPKAFDCAELTRWAAHKAGVDLPDGSWMQFLKLKQQHMLIPVDEAINTPGALLFRFSSEPQAGGLRPGVARRDQPGQRQDDRGSRPRLRRQRVLGQARVQLRGRHPGDLGIAVHGRRRAGRAPATGSLATMFAPDPGAPLTATMSTADSDHDGLTDAFEARIGSNPHLADTDHDGLNDAFEVATSGTDPTSAHSSQDGTCRTRSPTPRASVRRTPTTTGCPTPTRSSSAPTRTPPTPTTTA